jgi:pimeloyl-ACP methyl ester carboxylesterase
MKKRSISHLVIYSVCFSSLSYGQNNLSGGDHFANINGIKIHYYVSGKGPVCLVPSPGWGPSVAYLKNSLIPFENYFTIVYYDTRKSGLSTGPEDSTKYTNQDFINDMDSLRVYLKQSKIWLMGHSMGGYHVLNYGIHHSNNLKGIIAFSPLAGRDSLKKAESTRIVMKRKQDPYFAKGVDYLPGGDSVKNNLVEQMQVTLPFYFHDTNKVRDLINIGFLQLNDTAYKYTRSSYLSRFSPSLCSAGPDR